METLSLILTVAVLLALLWAVAGQRGGLLPWAVVVTLLLLVQAFPALG
jgi:hypothetical protein